MTFDSSRTRPAGSGWLHRPGWAFPALGSLRVRQSVGVIRRTEFEGHLAPVRVERNDVFRFGGEDGCRDAGYRELPLIAHCRAIAFPGIAVLDADEAEVGVSIVLVCVAHCRHNRTKTCVPKRQGDKLARYGAIRLVNIRTTIGLGIRRQLCRPSAAR
jgi:hypothetical protein